VSFIVFLSRIKADLCRGLSHLGSLLRPKPTYMPTWQELKWRIRKNLAERGLPLPIIMALFHSSASCISEDFRTFFLLSSNDGRVVPIHKNDVANYSGLLTLLLVASCLLMNA
jgi:hypothetical protein